MTDVTDYTIRRCASPPRGGRIAGLPRTLPVRKINAVLGFLARRTPANEGDGKVDRCWAFTIDGSECAIWDYKGARWSVGGSLLAAKALAGLLDVELTR